MKYFLGLISIVLLLSSSVVYGQEQMSISESRKKNLRQVLDYRYRGGFYSFEKLFNNTVEYPPVAYQNCILGIVIATFKVSCDGELKKITLKNPLRYGIDEQISNFFNASAGQWNKCDDDKYTRFDVPIQFTLEGTDTNTTDALLVVTGETLGYDCMDDDKYYEKAKKLLEKGKGKKALGNINVLLQRNPYNIEYNEMKTKALSLF